MIIGLTGSIAMGKTTAANMLRKYGIPVFDADKGVHDLMNIPNGVIANEIYKLYPEAISLDKDNNKIVNRPILSKLASGNDQVINDLERIIHPVILNTRLDYIEEQRKLGHDIIILDIPLLFETGSDKNVDKVITISCPLELQKTRALSRNNMTLEKFNHILSRQTPDKIKRQNSDFVVDSSQSLENMEQELIDIIDNLREIKTKKEL